MVSRYEVLDNDAGAGGFGRILKARDPILERVVAIKVLDPIFKLEPSEADKLRFKREARTLASLSHPHIPAIYDVEFDEESSDFRIIFAWIEGLSLAEYLKDRGVLTFDQARRWFTDVCSALDHAHSKSVIHRDIKPSNLILAVASDDCMLVDFGISLNKAEMDTLTGSSGVGTAGYMSPEQDRGDSLTPASDVYTLAIVLYECLAGIRPAVGSYRPLSTINGSIPPAADLLIQKCLSEDPVQRVQGAREFAERLNKALEPHASFTETLTQGSLYEIQAALATMSAGTYAGLPLGQRLTVMTRLRDLVRVNESRLQTAVASLLTELVRVAHRSRALDYQFIVQQSLQFGYEHEYSENWTGHGPLREALSTAAPSVEASAHSVICQELSGYLEGTSLEGRRKWYFHDLRILLQNLLANPNCAEETAEKLASRLDDVNVRSH